MRMKWNLGAMLALAALASCAPRTAPQPEPQEQPRPVVTRPEPAPPPPADADWRDVPLTPGGWTYRGDGRVSSASFGAQGAQPSFVVRCADRQILLVRGGAAGATTMVIRTSFGARNLPVTAQQAGLTASLAPADPMLDQMAFSRGRFTVEVPGLPILIIPAWPEPARVIEDCRS